MTARNAHAAQCMLCAHAQWRGRMVVGCLAFDDEPLPTNAGRLLPVLTYRAAATAPCPVRSPLHVGPDAYLAQDLPTKE